MKKDGLIVSKRKNQQHFTILMTGRNCKKWVRKCLRSVTFQDYINYEIIMIDADSTDGTYEIARKFAKNNSRMKLIRNQTRKYQMENILTGAKIAKPNTIIVSVDSDDWLPHKNVLQYLNQIYDQNVWMTYGSFQPIQKRKILFFSNKVLPSFFYAYPKEVIENNTFRSHIWFASHLRTFRRELFIRINENDLKYRGKFPEMAADIGFMLPMLEMSGDRSKYIKEILYIYNKNNPLNDDRTNREYQREIDLYFRSKPPYQKLDSLSD